MALDPARPSATVLPLPTAAATPVLNPPRKGRYPRNITGLASARSIRAGVERASARRSEEIRQAFKRVECMREYLAQAEARLAEAIRDDQAWQQRWRK